MLPRSLLVAACTLCLSSPGRAQTVLVGKLEISMAASLQAVAVHTDHSEVDYMVNLPLRVGYFVSEGWELEAEAIVSIREDIFDLARRTRLMWVLSANSLHHVATRSSVRPFLLVGAGLSDASTAPLGNVVLVSDISDSIRGVFNLGIGCKALVGSRSALRVEYRLQYYPSDVGEDLIGFTSHTLQAGVSLFVL